MPAKPAYVCGIDEVGRGSLAGPVTIGVCWLPSHYPLTCYHIKESKGYARLKPLWSTIRDSKKCTETLRGTIFSTLSEQVNYITLSASADMIDRYGIGVCLSHLIGVGISLSPIDTKKVYIDGKIKLLSSYNDQILQNIIHYNSLEIPFQDIRPTLPHEKPSKNPPLERVVKGDDTFLCIALASIFAKETRDTLMKSYALQHPQYHWDKNKGYATEIHRDAIQLYGVTTHHRKTWIK